MKRVGLILGMFIICFAVNAEKVEKHLAREIAGKFFSTQLMQKQDKAVKEIVAKQKENVITHYIINYEPEGWALVAADDRIKPVLAYSTTGKFNATNSDKSPELQYWLNGYQQQIYDVIKGNTLKKENKEWDNLLSGQDLDLKSANVDYVDPILNVKWNQNNGWNRFCPEDEEGPGGHAYVGCVAVAMAQAMTSAKYPSASVGEHRYVSDNYGTIYLNYSNEPSYNWDNMPLASSNDENARLLYHCAVSVNMDFGPDGSGTLSSKVVGALKEHFGYTSDISYVKRYGDDDEWKQLLKSEIDKGNVLIYSGDPGTGDPGHSFNIDGYDRNLYFHFNWGWSGSYNDYYSIDNINPGDNKFNVNQDVVIGIATPYFGPTDITLSKQEVKEGLPAGSFVANVNVKDNSADDSFSYELDGGPRFPSGRNEAAFYIENDSLKTKYVFNATEKDEYLLNIKVTDSDFNVYSEEFTINITSIPTSIAEREKNETPNVYFSQSENSIIINSETDKYINTQVRVCDILGRAVYTGIVDNAHYPIQASHLNTGIYVVLLVDTENSLPLYSGKIVVNKN
ncbi:MAG TPA: C10 family peptidase [Draconibacterium sp.]|nr:C10 family peptidase [Draconibacterium sp.]